MGETQWLPCSRGDGSDRSILPKSEMILLDWDAPDWNVTSDVSRWLSSSGENLILGRIDMERGLNGWDVLRDKPFGLENEIKPLKHKITSSYTQIEPSVNERKSVSTNQHALMCVLSCITICIGK